MVEAIEQADLLMPEAKPAVVLNTAHAYDMLHKRYQSPEWALLSEVAPSTGGGTRYADAVAVNLWQSRGHAVHGFEIKVSRSDWLRELKKPEKAEESVYRYCDHWFIVAPKGVVKDGELPPTWGLLELRDSGLIAKVAAPRLEAKPIGRAFFASLMRRGHEQIGNLAERMQRQAVNEARGAINEQVQKEVERNTRKLRELQERLKKVHDETGIDFTEYYGPPVETIKLAQKLAGLQTWSGAGALSQLAQLAAQLEAAAKTVRSAMKETGLQEDAP